MTGDDHNTDALIAALRSPALPAERAGEAAAVSAMLGVMVRTSASTRSRAGRGIAIAVVTVASLGVGGLAAAGPGVFQAAASKARSFITADPADRDSSADAVIGDDPPGGSSPEEVAGDPGSLAALGAAATAEPGAGGAVTCADGNHGQTVSSVAPGASVPAAAQSDCGLVNNGSGPAATGTPPPECTDGNHGDAVAEAAKASVPPSAEESHDDIAHETCTPQGPQGNAVQGSNPNKPTDPANAGNANGSTNGNQNPGTSNSGNQTGAGNGNGGTGGGTTPAVTTPPQGNGNANGAGNGSGGTNNGQGPDANNGAQGAGQGTNNGKSNADGSAPTDSVPANNGKGSANGNGNGNGG